MRRAAGPGTRRRFQFTISCLIAIFVLCFVVSSFQPALAEGAGSGSGGDSGVGGIVTHYLMSVGWVMGIVLGSVSVAMVFLIVLLFIDLRLGAAIPPGFVEEFTDTVNKRRFKEAYDLAKNDGSFLARVLSTGMSRLQYGIEDAREAALNMVDTIRTGKESLVSYLAVVGTLGPLLGLVGTVVGMIGAFRVLGTASQDAATFPKLAAQLSHALVVTFFGIGLSVPAIVAHQFFRNRLAAVTQDTANIGDDLLTQMYHNSKKAAGGPTPSTSPDARQPAPAPAGQGVVAAR